jgi:hypothetical protein
VEAAEEEEEEEEEEECRLRNSSLYNYFHSEVTVPYARTFSTLWPSSLSGKMQFKQCRRTFELHKQSAAETMQLRVL